MPTFAPHALTEFTAAIFEASRVPRADAEVIARGLVGANLRGHDSHGVMRMTQYLGLLERGEYRTGVDLIVEHETPAVIVCDAQWGFGQVQAHRLLDRISPKAKALGVAIGTARQCGHIGRLGEFAERAAEEGLILIATVNIDGNAQRVAPPGGIAPRLGTNPLCAAVPTHEGPVVLDFGTSIVAEGKVRVHYLDGKRPVPEGWLIDHEGMPTTDPSVLYEAPSGSLLPMGGDQPHKGFGLGLILDMLAGGLTGGRTCYAGAGAARGNNVVFVLIDPESFAGREYMESQADQLTAYVRSCPRRADVDRILLPGDPERATMLDRTQHGIPIADAHWAILQGHAERLGVSVIAPIGPR